MNVYQAHNQTQSQARNLLRNQVGNLNVSQQPALALFAVGMLGLAVLALVYADFAMGWQPVAPWVPGRTALAYLSGAWMLVCGGGLLFASTEKWAVRVLFPYLVAWTLLKVPALIVAPQIEGVWLGFGEIAALMAGGWTLLACLGDLPASSPGLSWATGERGVRWARLWFGLWLLPIGLSHILYTPQTTVLIPDWLPAKVFWAYLTGAGQMACGLGILSGVLRRVAAWCEAAMISLFALLVWAPKVLHDPHSRLNWTAFWITVAIGAAAWVVAQNTSAWEKASEVRDQETGVAAVLRMP